MRLKKKDRWANGTYEHHEEIILYFEFVSYTMVHIACFEEVYFHIRNQSCCFCKMSFLKAGLYFISWCRCPCHILHCGKLLTRSSREQSKQCQLNLSVGSGGAAWLRMDGRLPPGFQKAIFSLLISKASLYTHFCEEFWWKHPFLLFFCEFVENPPMYKENPLKRYMDPFFENFGPRRPTIWFAHTCTLYMLCTPRGMIFTDPWLTFWLFCSSQKNLCGSRLTTMKWVPISRLQKKNNTLQDSIVPQRLIPSLQVISLYSY